MTNPIHPRATEYGGWPGLVQPEPHTPTAAERLSAAVRTDPSDVAANADTVIAEDRKRGAERLNK